MGLMRRWFKEVWEDRNEATIDELLDPEVKAYGLGDEPLDLEGFREAWRSLHETFDDFKVEIDSFIAKGEMTALRLTASGIHVGDGLGFPATGKPVSFQVQTVGEWRDGKLINGWNCLDFGPLYRQLGVKLVL